MANHLKDFFLQIPKLLGELLKKFGLPKTEELYGIENYWTKIMVSFCVASAAEVAIVSAQIQSQLPPIFQFFSLSILFAFSSFFTSKFIDSTKFPQTARVLERVGVFFTVTGFFIALTIAFPHGLCFKVTTWVVYVICLAVVLVCNCDLCLIKQERNIFPYWLCGFICSNFVFQGKSYTGGHRFFRWFWLALARPLPYRIA